MKITIYTINDCQFSKQEKEYLKAHNLPYEEKNLEANKEFLTEMLAISNNFAGTPVTKIEKDDGQIIVLKGFTPKEFDETLGLTKRPSVVQTAGQTTNQIPPSQMPQSPASPTPPSPPPVQPPKPQDMPSPQPPVELSTPVPEPAEPSNPVVPPANEPTNQPKDEQTAPANPQLSSILNNLQSMASSESSANNQPSANNSSSANNLPNIPNPNF